MKKSVFILLLFGLKCCGQSADWKTGNEKYVISYEVMQSLDQSKWISKATIQPLRQPDSNWYSYAIPAGPYYYKIKANMVAGTFLSIIKYVTPTAEVIVTNALCKTTGSKDVLTWTTKNEQNIKYYQIDKTTNNSTYTKVTTVKPKGNGSYSYTVYRFLTKKPTYRLTTYYLNNTSGSVITFKN